ncbi:hypothetical protein LSTR_LSTR012015 [Laodelphax striatellus]|uniref:Fibronectin type-III domain-containing protein n=1 Tax=Laodelphax striatellus TaxID=195883 RepID=A0A482XLS6_LAOST|nr:hypothetical protein LSTR_LSTR012015 [Laodelphax striatellus]
MHDGGRPDAPEPPKADRITKASVTLSWRPPRHDGGSKIRGYILQKKKKGDADWSSSKSASSKCGDTPVPNCLYTMDLAIAAVLNQEQLKYITEC